MFTLRMARLLTLALVLAGGLALPILATSSSAETGRGTVVVHLRACDADAEDLFEDCHDTGVANALVKVDNRQSKATDANGDVSFKRVVAGDVLITLTDGYDAGQFSSFRALCSNVIAGTGPNEAFVRISEFPDFYARLGSGDRLVCDLYYIP